jgi:hypothetical protein
METAFVRTKAQNEARLIAMASRPRILRSVPDATPDTAPVVAEDAVDPAFHEETYLRAFPDIADAVRRGFLPSGLAHFQQSGKAEGRLENPAYLTLLAARERPAAPAVIIDTLTASEQGTLLIIGWVDDRTDPLTTISLDIPPDQRVNWTSIPRLSRQDVARSLNARTHHPFGFLLLSAGLGGQTAAPPLFRFESGAEAAMPGDSAVASDADLRDMALGALVAGAEDKDPRSCFSLLDQHAGLQIAALNKQVADRSAAQIQIQRTGPHNARYRASVITTRRGPADQIVPRLTLMAAGANASDIEYIVVIDDPDQYEAALRAARVAELTLGLSLTLVFQPLGDGTGLGDAAASTARSDRLIFIDPSVLPRDPDWAFTHDALITGLPAEQTRLMGGLLYHPDGGLAGGGHDFTRAAPVRPDDAHDQDGEVRITTIAHPAPAAATHLTRSHPSAAPSPGFLSVERVWFEKTGGFSRQYFRGGPEELDFCLRALTEGVQPWIHPLRLWSFQDGSAAQPRPTGHGTILNEWLLHRRWDAKIAADLCRRHEA